MFLLSSTLALACSAGFSFFWRASAEFSVWSSFWFCKMSGAGKSKRGGDDGTGNDGDEKQKTPARKEESPLT